MALSPEAQAGFDNFLAQHGGSEKAAAQQLWEDNHKYRRTNVQLREDLEEERRASAHTKAEMDKKLPKDGSVILSSDEATRFKAFQDLKLEPGDIAKSLEAGKTSVAELARIKEDERVGEVATVAGMKPKVLRTITKDKGLHVEVKEENVTVDGKTEKQKVAYVRPAADANAVPEPLTAYAERELKEYLPALRVEEAEVNAGTPGVRVPEQSATTGKAPKTDVATQYVEAKYSSPGQRKKTTT